MANPEQYLSDPDVIDPACIRYLRHKSGLRVTRYICIATYGIFAVWLMRLNIKSTELLVAVMFASLWFFVGPLLIRRWLIGWHQIRVILVRDRHAHHWDSEEIDRIAKFG